MTVSYYEFGTALGGNEVNGKFQVKCPAHEDNRESLSITRGDKHEVVLQCFAGCKFKEILEAAKLRAPSLDWGVKGTTQWIDYEFDGLTFSFPVELGDVAPRELEDVYAYQYTDGSIAKWKARFSGKTFRQYVPVDGKPRLAGKKNGFAPEIPWMLPELLQARKDGRKVSFTEGEKDAKNLHQKFNLAVTTFGGVGNKWISAYDQWFSGIKEVIVFADNDHTKKKNEGLLYAQSIAAHCLRLDIQVKLVVMPDGHKDVSDWLDAGGTQEQLVALVKNTEYWAPPKYKVPDTITVERPAMAEARHDDEAYKNISHFLDTDTRNAERFAHFYAKDARFVPRRGWYVWNGKHWEEDETGMVQEMAKDISRRIVADIAKQDMTVRSDLEKWAKRTESAAKITALLKLASSDRRLVMRFEEFDSYDRTRYLLNCNNGTVDMLTGERRKHRREDFITRISPYDFNPEIEPKMWEAHIHRIFGGDSELIAWFQMVSGYMFTGETYWQTFQHWHGPPATGKSETQGVYTKLGGSYAANLDPQSLVQVKQRSPGQEDDIASTIGCRFLFAPEVKKQHRLDESLLRALTGGDTARVKNMGQKKFDLRGCAKIVFTGNERPQMTMDAATERRAIEVPFVQELHKDLWIENFGQIMLEKEAGGILAWLQQGAAMAKLKFLNDLPPVILAKRQEWVAEADLLQQWLNDRTDKTNSYAETDCDVAFKDFNKYIKEGGYHHQYNKITFGRMMSKKGFTSEHTGHRRFYKGLYLIGGD